MNPEELPEALDDMIPQKPSAAGWGERIRRRRRNRRVGAASAAGVAAAAVLAAAVQLGGQPTMTATPMPADPSTQEPVVGPVDPTVCAESALRDPSDGTGLQIEDMVRAVVCGPVLDDPTASLQILLPDELAADIVAEITVEDRMAGFQPGIGRSAPSLVLLSEHGDPYTLQGTPDGYQWYPPSSEGGIHRWVPSDELADRMWALIGASGECTVPGRIKPGQVPVHVYDGGGGADAVTIMAEHLEGAGFPVTITGEHVAPSLGGPVYLRASGDNRGTSLVASWSEGSAGEMSRDDNIVDVVVTDSFTVDVLKEGQPDISDGNFRCTGRETAAPSGPSSAVELEPTSVPESEAPTPEPTHPSSAAAPASPRTEEPTAGEPQELPFTEEDLEQAWFDDGKEAELPSSIRERMAIQKAAFPAGSEVVEADVSISQLDDDVVQLHVTIFVGDETASAGSIWTEHHRLLGDGISEALPDR